MLTVLFSPSEGKRPGGSGAPLHDLLFGLDDRNAILERYNTLVNGDDFTPLAKLFGIKSETECARFRQDLFRSPTMRAIERYNGVAYDYLALETLPEPAQRFLEAHCIIFSNLFGPIRAGEMIPDYKVKQGEDIGGIAPERYYAERFAPQMDALLEGDDVLDLRAGYYTKFYKLKQPHTTLKFIKGGKVVSHWAKAYRGIVLREIAQHAVEDIEAFMRLEIDGLMVEEIKKSRLKTEIVYTITA